MSDAYGARYKATATLDPDFTHTVVFDLDNNAVYRGVGFPFACSLMVSSDCAAANLPSDYIMMGGTDGYLYAAYNKDFRSLGCPTERHVWTVVYATTTLLEIDPISNLPTTGTGLAKLPFVVVRGPGSTRSRLTGVISSNTANTITPVTAFTSGAEPQAGDLVLIGGMACYVRFSELHTAWPHSIVRGHLDVRDRDFDARYKIEVFAPDTGRMYADPTNTAVASRSVSPNTALQERNGFGLRPKPEYATTVKLSWDQLDSPMEIVGCAVGVNQNTNERGRT